MRRSTFKIIRSGGTLGNSRNVCGYRMASFSAVSARDRRVSESLASAVELRMAAGGELFIAPAEDRRRGSLNEGWTRHGTLLTPAEARERQCA